MSKMLVLNLNLTHSYIKYENFMETQSTSKLWDEVLLQ